MELAAVLGCTLCATVTEDWDDSPRATGSVRFGLH